MRAGEGNAGQEPSALAQFLVPLLALLIQPDDFSPGIPQVFALNLGFVLLFAASALLFRHAGRTSGGPLQAT